MTKSHAQEKSEWQEELRTNTQKHQNELQVVQTQMESERERAKRNEAEMQRVDDEMRRLQSSGDKEEELRVMKISYEKMISAKDKEIEEVEERLRERMAKDARNGDIQQHMAKKEVEWERKMQAVVSQHQKELTVLHQTQQKLLDMKDKELEDFSYRLRTVTSAQQKDLEKLHQAHRAKIAEMEEVSRALTDKFNGNAMELRWATQENTENEAKIRDQANTIAQLLNERDQYREENVKMLSVINTLRQQQQLRQ
ncbi:hypothetical protein BDB00DRAFT_377073 [Zychaea mexicana]|uniref:uncharacterized protein n=1 Tax=Zychaea mexicana TaxID=64656 RepID=UPI0022FE17FC|nr:uncharacterized protein BDB00DRAFT_377073 [Zychaea mexicana]KAI9493353.1 hypothetical protein BDB00DRAFT_377073 [Zychaea mexicana]